jgi:hypothetical protein
VKRRRGVRRGEKERGRKREKRDREHTGPNLTRLSKVKLYQLFGMRGSKWF